MQEQDRTALYVSLQPLGIVFRQSLDTIFLEAYYAALEDLPLDALRYAAGMCLRHEPHFPPPCTLRDYAVDYLKEQHDIDQKEAERRMLGDPALNQALVRHLINSIWPGELSSEPLYEPQT